MHFIGRTLFLYTYLPCSKAYPEKKSAFHKKHEYYHAPIMVISPRTTFSQFIQIFFFCLWRINLTYLMLSRHIPSLTL